MSEQYKKEDEKQSNQKYSSTVEDETKIKLKTSNYTDKQSHENLAQITLKNFESDYSTQKAKLFLSRTQETYEWIEKIDDIIQKEYNKIEQNKSLINKNQDIIMTENSFIEDKLKTENSWTILKERRDYLLENDREKEHEILSQQNYEKEDIKENIIKVKERKKKEITFICEDCEKQCEVTEIYEDKKLVAVLGDKCKKFSSKLLIDQQ